MLCHELRSPRPNWVWLLSVPQQVGMLILMSSQQVFKYTRRLDGNKPDFSQCAASFPPWHLINLSTTNPASPSFQGYGTPHAKCKYIAIHRKWGNSGIVCAELREGIVYTHSLASLIGLTILARMLQSRGQPCRIATEVKVRYWCETTSQVLEAGYQRRFLSAIFEAKYLQICPFAAVVAFPRFG